MYLKTNRCSILIDFEEENFIRENIFKNNLTKKNIKRVITSLYYNGSKRYFSKRHINEIVKNLYNDMISEEIGRNLRSDEKSGTITDCDILNRKGITNAEVGICANSGSDIVTLYFKTKKNKILYFDSPDAANNFIKTLKYKNL
tara:strand:- start:48 stop:479 length:432 start_codon:yes stop_codon:yes gene_type:complete